MEDRLIDYSILDNYAKKYAHNEFTRLFFEAGLKLKTAVQRKLNESNIDTTSQQAAVLYSLWKKDGISQTELSHITNKQKSNLTRIIDNLEKKDLVERVVNKNDRRSFNIKLTDKGYALCEKILPIFFEVLNQAFCDFTPEDDKVLNGFIARMIKNLDSLE
ncbi:MAG TPA: MarR family transcriptional regulator [Alphaproteobacteria bacterium]|nr:MarR family transcriptional regulator [Alphaproteobacteria bacterium]